ncbi:MAG: RING finger protein [Bacteroidota bacterium]
MRQQTPGAAAPPPAGPPPPGTPQAPPPAPPPYRPFGGSAPPAYDDGIVIETEPEPRSGGPAGSLTTGLHAAAGDEIGKTCPYCRFPLKPGEQVMTCPACKVPHHADCWRENQGCTTYGCQGVSATPAASAPPVLRPTGVGPSPSTVGMPDFGSLQQTEFMGRANNALILAIIGMFCCAPLSLIGLFMGISILGDLKRTNTDAPGPRGKAVASIVIGVLACVGWLIYLITMAANQGR